MSWKFVKFKKYESQKYNHNANTISWYKDGSISFDSGYGVIFGVNVHVPQ